MELPEIFKKENKMTLIKKYFYGLKQATAFCHDDMKEFLMTHGMIPTGADVYKYTNKIKDTYIIIHVDDMWVMGPNKSKT